MVTVIHNDCNVIGVTISHKPHVIPEKFKCSPTAAWSSFPAPCEDQLTNLDLVMPVQSPSKEEFCLQLNTVLYVILDYLNGHSALKSKYPTQHML